MSNILDVSDILKSQTFYVTKGDKEKYFCKCGKHFTVDALVDNSGIEDVIKGDEDLEHAIKSAKISLRDDIICPNCKTNYKIPENHKKLIEVGRDFASGYFMEETDGLLTISLANVKSESPNEELQFKELVRKISFKKDTNKLFFKDFNSKEKEIDLDSIVDVVKRFFDIETNIVIGIFDLHQFMIKLSKSVSDSESMKTINSFMDSSRVNSSIKDNDSFIKSMTILLSVIKYSNLSTIAMTKSPLFLYELLKESNPPKSEELKKANVTSPIKIFNFLSSNYIKKVNSEISEDRVSVNEFVFSSDIQLEDHEDHSKKVAGADYEEVSKDTMSVSKGETRELKINVKNIHEYEAKVSKTSSGDIDVLHIDGDGQISKFIYKKLKKFHDYKQLLKYMKHLEYKQLVELMTKYDYDLIVNMIDVIYHRVDVDMEEIKRLIPLFEDHCKVKTKEVKVKTNTYNKGEDIKTEYKYIKEFDFGFYDDCRMMLTTLEFDPRKDFYKIKKNSILKAFHDEVVKYYSAIQLEEEGGYKGYFNKFKFLEDRENYNGPLVFEIIDTPKAVVAEGREMHHSVGSYSVRLLEGDYILLRVYDSSEDLPEGELKRFTMGLHFKSNTGLEFDQLKSFANKIGSNRLKELVLLWLKAKEINVNERRPDIRIRK